MKQPQFKPVQRQVNKSMTLIGVVFFLLLWQILSLSINNQVLLPGPLKVVEALVTLVQTNSFRLGILRSLLAIVSGFLCGLIIGVSLGHLAYFIRQTRSFINPFIFILKSSPLAALTIILMIWLKTSILPFVLILMAIIPPIYYATKSGLTGVPNEMLEMAFVFQFRKRDRYRTIYLPALIKDLLPSLDYTSGLAWKAGITGEIMAQPFARIGTNLYNSKIQLESAQVLASLTVILILSFSLSLLIKKLISYINNKQQPQKEDFQIESNISATMVLESDQQQLQQNYGNNKSEFLSEQTSIHSIAQTQQTIVDAPSIISIENLNKSFDQLKVLSDLTSEVFEGLITVVQGPSGQGKTTLFRLLTGLEKPDSGKISFNKLIKFSYSFQDVRLLEEYTLSDNLLFAARLKKNSLGAQDFLNYWEPRIIELDLPLTKKIHTFSGGMKQKASLIRALAANSDIVILDEVFRELDLRSEQQAIDLLKKEKGIRTVLLASHRQDIAQKLADQIIQL